VIGAIEHEAHQMIPVIDWKVVDQGAKMREECAPRRQRFANGGTYVGKSARFVLSQPDRGFFLKMANETQRIAVGFSTLILVLVGAYALGINSPLLFDDSLLLKDSFRQAYGDSFRLAQRLLSYGSFFWIETIVGEGWWKQRWVNLAIHIGTVIALFQFYRTLAGVVRDESPISHQKQIPVAISRDFVVLASVAFFALNPMAVYAVAYLIQRSILMATLATVLGLWFFTLALIAGQKKFFLFALLAYIAALAAKEHALLAPLCAVPLYIFIRRPSVHQMLRIGAIGAALALVAGGGFALIYGQIIGVAFDEYSKTFLKQLDELSPGTSEHAWPLSIFNQMHLFTQYGWRWLFPIPGAMSIDLRPPFPLGFFSYPHLLGALAYLLTLVGGFWALLRWRDARSLLGLSLLMAIILHGTEFVAVWVQDPFVLYRSYLWAIAIPGLLIALLQGISSRALLMGSVIVGALLTAGSVERILSLNSLTGVWTDAISKLPDDPRAVGRWRPYLNRGVEYMGAGMFDLALRDFSAADAYGDPGQFGQFNRGVVFYTTKKYQLAIEAFDKAEQKGYADPNLLYQRGLARFESREIAKAYEDFDRAIRAGLPEQLRLIAQARRGVIAVDLRDNAGAIKDLESVISHFPGDKMIKVSLGIAHAREGDPHRAMELLGQILQNEPFPLAYYGRALAAYRLEEKSAALTDIEAAINLDDKNTGFQVLRDKIRALR
jgi:tetratricopeptide (TPR) repeat protein